MVMHRLWRGRLARAAFVRGERRASEALAPQPPTAWQLSRFRQLPYTVLMRRWYLFSILLFVSALAIAQVAPPNPAPEQDKKPITKQQAEELFRSVDDILKW